MNLVDLLRPGSLVELGTHAGDSYCAFCQAVAEVGAATRCYAVDTWRGDAHAGQFDDDVLAALRAHHDPLYGGFSRLIQSTFAEALPYFGDASVDLLHIDGYHTFEAVKGDFDSWLPKMSEAGVVLLHDTNVREREFGVWALWQELSGRYPHFEFLHGHGLGIVATGEPPAPLKPLLEATEQDATLVRSLFAELGRRLTQEKAMRAGAAERERLTRDAEQRDRDIRALSRSVAELQGRITEQQGRITEQQGRITEQQGRITELEGRIRQESAAAEERLRAARSEAELLGTDLREAQRKLQGVEASKAWRALQRYRELRDAALSQRRLGRQLYDRVVRRKK